MIVLHFGIAFHSAPQRTNHSSGYKAKCKPQNIFYCLCSEACFRRNGHIVAASVAKTDSATGTHAGSLFYHFTLSAFFAMVHCWSGWKVSWLTKNNIIYFPSQNITYSICSLTNFTSFPSNLNTGTPI